jgi:hypothetical protein
MRDTLFAIVIALLPLSSVRAEQPGPLRPDKPASSDRLLPLKGAAAPNSCSAFGPGFVKVDGTGTCIKVGGSASISAGGSR